MYNLTNKQVLPENSSRGVWIIMRRIIILFVLNSRFNLRITIHILIQFSEFQPTYNPGRITLVSQSLLLGLLTFTRVHQREAFIELRVGLRGGEDNDSKLPCISVESIVFGVVGAPDATCSDSVGMWQVRMD